MTLRIAMVAGETSGDMLAAPLISAIEQRWPQAHCAGIGGALMRAQGFEAWWDIAELDVQGVVQIARQYPRLWRLRRDLIQRVLDFKADVFIGVDAPEFNLGVEQRLHAQGLKTMHYVSPSIWAWRASRLQSIQRDVDHMLCLFGFEQALYDQAGVPATTVGHPLAHTLQPVPDPSAAKAALGLDPARPVLALLPGSRSSEVRHLAPRFLAACRILLNARPELQIVLPSVAARRAELHTLIDHAELETQVRLLQGQSHDALAACDVTLIASGTATLEAMLIGCPMVVAYAMPSMSFHLIKWLSTTPWVSMPNILSQHTVVPELLQTAATPAALAAAVLDWLDHPDKARQLQQHFLRLHHSLQADSAQLAGDALAKLLAAPRKTPT